MYSKLAPGGSFSPRIYVARLRREQRPSTSCMGVECGGFKTVSEVRRNVESPILWPIG